jgi:hypothetical protein
MKGGGQLSQEEHSAQTGELKHIIAMRQNAEDASMDNLSFLLFISAAIFTPFPMTIPGKSLSALLTAQPLCIRPEYIFLCLGWQQDFFKRLSAFKLILMIGY